MRTQVLVLSVLLASPTALVATSDWSQFRGFGTTSVADLPDGAAGLELAWKVPLGSGYSNVSVAEGVAVTMFASGEEDVIAAFDAATGAERWRVVLGPKYAGHDGSDDGPVGTPTIVDGVVYALGPRGALVALALADGAQKWRVDLDENNSTVPFYGYTASPLVAGELVLLATGGEGHLLSAFDRATGVLRWARGDDTIAYQTPLLIELGGKQQVLVTSDYFLHGLNPSDGSVLWQLRHSEGEQAEESAHATAVDGERFLVKFGQGGRLYRFDGQGVQEVWRTRAFGNTFALPVYHEGHFYGFTGRFLTCARASDGEIVWRSRPPGGLGLSLVDGVLVVLEPSGALVLVEATPEEYREITRLPALERGDYAFPSYAGGRFFVRNLSELAALDVKTGTTAPVAAAPSLTAATAVLGTLAKWVAEVEALPVAQRQARVDAELPAGSAIPRIEASGLTHFIWRGEAEDIGLSGDIVPQGEELGLYHVEGTDLWLRSLELDPAGQYSYAYTVSFGRPSADPNNPHTIDNGFAVFSDLRMPQWPAAAHLDPPAADHPRGTLDSFPFRSDIRDTTREIKVWRPATYGADPAARFPLLIVNHGDNLLRGGLFQHTLDNLVGTSVEPIVVAFVPRTGGPEYGGADVDGYVSFLVDELIPHLEKHYRLDPSRRAIAGPASAGVTALYAALAKPGVFSRVGLQSYYTIEPASTQIDTMLAAAGAKPELVHVVWSRRDYAIPNGPNTADTTAALLEKLRAAKIPVVELIGTHSPNWGGWRGQDDDLLTTLFPLPATP